MISPLLGVVFLLAVGPKKMTAQQSAPSLNPAPVATAPTATKPGLWTRLGLPGRLAVLAGTVVVVGLLAYRGERNTSTTTTTRAPTSTPAPATTTAQAPTSTSAPRTDPIPGDEVKVTQNSIGCPSEDTFKQTINLLQRNDTEAAAKLGARENCRGLKVGTTGVVVTLASGACVQPKGEPDCLWTNKSSLTIAKRSNQK